MNTHSSTLKKCIDLLLEFVRQPKWTDILAVYTSASRINDTIVHERKFTFDEPSFLKRSAAMTSTHPVVNKRASTEGKGPYWNLSQWVLVITTWLLAVETVGS